MNKSEFVDKIAGLTDFSKADAERAVQAMLDTITGALKSGDNVAFPGFGTFEVKERAARTGRNPQTGEVIDIPAKNVVKFKAGKALKEAVE